VPIPFMVEKLFHPGAPETLGSSSGDENPLGGFLSELEQANDVAEAKPRPAGGVARKPGKRK